MSTEPVPTPQPFVFLVTHSLKKMDPETILCALRCLEIMPPEDVKQVRPSTTCLGALRVLMDEKRVTCPFVESIVAPFYTFGYVDLPAMVFDPYEVARAINTENVDRMIGVVRPKMEMFAQFAVPAALRGTFESGRIFSPKEATWIRDSDLATDLLGVLAARSDIPTEHLVATVHGLIQVTKQVVAWRLSNVVGLDVDLDLSGVRGPDQHQKRPLVLPIVKPGDPVVLDGRVVGIVASTSPEGSGGQDVPLAPEP